MSQATIQRYKSHEKATQERHPFGPEPMIRSDRPVSLICGECGRCRKYKVGQVLIDLRKPVQETSLEETIGFTRYFRCRECDSPGPWRLPANTAIELYARAIADAVLNNGDASDCFGVMGTFDGQTWQTIAQAVEHICKLIEQDGDDSFLWVRLGNLYKFGECPDKAEEAYRRAVELNEADIEAQAMLGNLLAGQDLYDDAVPHLHAVLTHARGAKQVRRELRYELVGEAIQCLLRIHDRTNGRYSVLPERAPEPPADPNAPAVLHLFKFDLRRESDWKRMCATFIEDLPKPGWNPFRRHPSRGNSALPPVIPLHGIGRNQPCPCGSGQKYKRCCGKTR